MELFEDSSTGSSAPAGCSVRSPIFGLGVGMSLGEGEKRPLMAWCQGGWGGLYGEEPLRGQREDPGGFLIPGASSCPVNHTRG